MEVRDCIGIEGQLAGAIGGWHRHRRPAPWPRSTGRRAGSRGSEARRTGRSPHAGGLRSIPRLPLSRQSPLRGTGPPTLLTLLGPKLEGFFPREPQPPLEERHRLIRQKLSHTVTSSRWLQRSQRVGRKCSTCRPSLIQASLGESGGRLCGPRLTPPRVPSPAGGAGPLTSRCSDGSGALHGRSDPDAGGR